MISIRKSSSIVIFKTCYNSQPMMLDELSLVTIPRVICLRLSGKGRKHHHEPIPEHILLDLKCQYLRFVPSYMYATGHTFMTRTVES